MISIVIAAALTAWELRATNPFLDVGVYVILHGLTQRIEVGLDTPAFVTVDEAVLVAVNGVHDRAVAPETRGAARSPTEGSPLDRRPGW